MKLLFGIVSLLLINFTLLSYSLAQQVVEPVVYLIPAGYMGNVYIFHNVPNGVPIKREDSARVYEIPKDGILRSQSPEVSGLFRPHYFYLTPDGKREEITGIWFSSIHDTPENRADKTIGIFFPRIGKLQERVSLKVVVNQHPSLIAIFGMNSFMSVQRHICYQRQILRKTCSSTLKRIQFANDGT